MRLTTLRIDGFRGLTGLEVGLDPITTIVGEDGAAKAALVDLLDLVLGPGSSEKPAFAPSDFAPVADGRPQRIRVSLAFAAEDGAGAATVVEIRGDCTPSRGGLRTSAEVFVSGGGVGRDPAAHSSAWRRLRAACPVFVLGADRKEARRSLEEVEDGPSAKHAEIARLYRKLRESHGRLTARELEAARLVLRDELHLAPPDLPRRADRRELVDIVDWRRPIQREVADDAVQDVLMRLLRAGLVLEAKRSARIGPDAHPIVVVDSPDARLHPILTARVWRFLHSVASQVIVTTNSAEVVAASPLRALRRLAREGRRVRVMRIQPKDFSIDDLRRLVYHVRFKRGSSLLARAWLLMEGETEIWILSEFASMLGYSFAAEGVACIEFAQCGLVPLIRMADQLGIGWHVLADGDSAGLTYATQARSRLNGRSAASRITTLRVPDVEHALWFGGYSDVFRRHAGNFPPHATPRAVISRAVTRASKPLLAIRVIEAALAEGSPGVPAVLASAIEAVVALARRPQRP